MYFVQRRTAMAINQMLNQKSLTLVGTVIAVLIGGVGVSLALSSPAAQKNEDPLTVSTTALGPEVTIENLPIVTDLDPSTDSAPASSMTTTSASQPASGISGNVTDEDDDEYDDEDDDEYDDEDEDDDDDDDDDEDEDDEEYEDEDDD